MGKGLGNGYWLTRESWVRLSDNPGLYCGAAFALDCFPGSGVQERVGRALLSDPTIPNLADAPTVALMVKAEECSSRHACVSDASLAEPCREFDEFEWVLEPNPPFAVNDLYSWVDVHVLVVGEVGMLRDGERCNVVHAFR